MTICSASGRSDQCVPQFALHYMYVYSGMHVVAAFPCTGRRTVASATACLELRAFELSSARLTHHDTNNHPTQRDLKQQYRPTCSLLIVGRYGSYGGRGVKVMTPQNWTDCIVAWVSGVTYDDKRFNDVFPIRC